MTPPGVKGNLHVPKNDGRRCVVIVALDGN